MGCIYLIILKNHVENNTRVLVGYEQHDLCDSYILDVLHDATENYFERGKFGCRNFHVTKTPILWLKVLKLFFLHLPMHVTLCFFDLFSYKFPRHRSWLGLNVFHICFFMFSFASILILARTSSSALILANGSKEALSRGSPQRI